MLNQSDKIECGLHMECALYVETKLYDKWKKNKSQNIMHKHDYVIRENVYAYRMRGYTNFFEI